MLIIKKNVNKILTIFLISHVVIWTLVPSITNHNLPLDTIEALAWGSNLDWGFNKHPPLSAFFVEIVYQIFGKQDWSYYLLSQSFIALTFFVIFKFSNIFFKNKVFSLLSVLILESILFYNFTTPEFNVNICQIPFWALSILYCWKGLSENKTFDWLLFGFFLALGVLSKYLFFYLIGSIGIFFIYQIINKKFNYKCLIFLIPFLLMLTPHLIWLINNDYITVTYGLHRTGGGDQNILDHVTHPMMFLIKQIGILIPFFLMILFLVKKIKFNINYKDKKLLFLLTISIIPFILILVTSILMGVKIRTMWMSPFYLFFGVLSIYIFQNKINLKKLRGFIYFFLFLFILAPVTYSYISISEKNKRTDYPGKKISKIVQKQWDEKFKNKIVLVSGDEWHAGNLSYHLETRPKWDNILSNNKNISSKSMKGGFILVANPDILNKICNGIFFKIHTQGFCMVGINK